MNILVWKSADILVTVLIAVVIGALFSWWAGTAVLFLGLVVVLRSRKPAIGTAYQRV